MTENKEEVPSEYPTNDKSENSTDESIPTFETEFNKENLEIENMEVHHHAHDPAAPHYKKNWKSYLWEFLMLFLAVFCGYLAEWQLEHKIEQSREKEFIKSMIEDAKIDTANINTVLKKNQSKLIYIDSLIEVCFNYENQKTNDYEIYYFLRKTISTTNTLKPTDRTLLQLKNSGGMRLIRNKAATDIIILYDRVENDVKSSQEYVDKSLYDYITSSYEIFNFKYLKPNTYVDVSLEAKLLSHDNLKLIQFGNRLIAYGGILSNYNVQLQKMKEHAVILISSLRQEYHLKD